MNTLHPDSTLDTSLEPSTTAMVMQTYSRGALAGVVGATAVMGMFLVFDTALGQPLYTPSVLGSLLFRGEMVRIDAAIEPGLVAAFTGLHVAAFASVGILASVMMRLYARTVRFGLGGFLAVSLTLFAVLEILLLSLAAVTDPGLVGMLGNGPIALANFLGALAMGGSLFIARKSDPYEA